VYIILEVGAYLVIRSNSVPFKLENENDHFGSNLVSQVSAMHFTKLIINFNDRYFFGKVKNQC